MDKAAITVFKSMILPLFDIGDSFYLGATQGLLDKLRVLQNRAVRLACGLHAKTNTDSLLAKFNLLPLNKCRTLHLLQYARLIAEQDGNLHLRMLRTRSHNEGRRITPRYRSG